MAKKSKTGSSPKQISVLIVDDSLIFRRLLKEIFERTNTIKIIGEAANGIEALDKVLKLSPDVIIMDMEMPLMDGYEATRQIKADHPACRVIALTIHGGEKEQEKAFQAGADEFIIKGAPLETLMEAIHNTSTSEQIRKGEKS